MSDEIKNKRKAKIILITATIVFVLLIIPGVIFGLMSAIVIDEAFKGDKNMLVIFFAFLATFPVISFLSFSSWIFYAVKKYELAIFISLMPLLNLIGIFILLALSYII